MKMHAYIRFVLSLLLIISNLSVAFSMHLCEGKIERVKLNHLDNQTCKMQKPVSCCAVKEEVKHCATPVEEKDEDCCKDIAYQDDFQDQQSVEIVKISPVSFLEFSQPNLNEFLFDQHVSTAHNFEFYVVCNAPPIYLVHQQLIFYEA